MSSRRICSIYRSPIKEEMYLYVDKAEGLQKVPEPLLAMFGKPVMVTTLLLDDKKKLARAQAVDVLAAIAEKGFFLQMPPLMETDMLSIAAQNTRLPR